jgi:hypothetical protein
MAGDEEAGEHLSDDQPGPEPGDRYEPESPGGDPPANPRRLPAWDEDERARPLGLVITAALLFVLVAAAVLFGGRGSFGPGGRPSLIGPDGKALGDILYSLQTDASCSPSSVDNATGSLAGHPSERCPSRDSSEASHPHN